MAKIIGAGPSPFVRKVRVACAEKQIPYEIDPAFPGTVDRAISPLGKIPAWQDERGALADSSVICAYLERVKPEPALYPTDAYEYGRALWFEEYADSALVAVFGPKIFFKRIIGPKFMGQPVDEAAINAAWTDEAPPLLDYLEGQLAGEYLVGSSFSIADIAVTSQFVNLQHSGFAPDGGRWPKLAAYVKRIMARPSFAALLDEERAMLGLA